MASKAQIIVTLGPASENKETFLAMVKTGADVARLNFSWGDDEEKRAQIETVRQTEKILGKKIPIIIDLPGPRVQKGADHGYNNTIISAITKRDRDCIAFGLKQNLDLFALSFVSSAKDVSEARQIVEKSGGRQKIIAKIERAQAVDNFDSILKTSDAVMIARGDLAKELPLEKMPFVEADIIKKCNQVGKPVITATGMLLSMTENDLPTRAEVTDVANAILLGSDAVMLSEETAVGRHPAKAVAMMEKITAEAEKHLGKQLGRNFNLLS